MARCLVALPGLVGDAGGGVKGAGIGKQPVAQAVDESDAAFVECGVAPEGDYAALGATAYGACYLGACRSGRSAREYEAVHRLDGGVEPVDRFLETFDMGVGQPATFFGAVGGEIAADVEESVLRHIDDVGYGAVGRFCGEQSHPRVEFVDGSVGFEAHAVFPDALSADERCCSGVAGAGV